MNARAFDPGRAAATVGPNNGARVTARLRPAAGSPARPVDPGEGRTIGKGNAFDGSDRAGDDVQEQSSRRVAIVAGARLGGRGKKAETRAR